MGDDGADGDMDKGDGKGAEAGGGTIFLFLKKTEQLSFGQGHYSPLLGC